MHPGKTVKTFHTTSESSEKTIKRTLTTHTVFVVDFTSRRKLMITTLSLMPNENSINALHETSVSAVVHRNGLIEPFGIQKRERKYVYISVDWSFTITNFQTRPHNLNL